MASKHRTAVGAFVLGGTLLFGLGLFLIGSRRMLFSASADYYTEFAQVSGLEAGAKVRVGGMDAGEVVDILVPQGLTAKFRLKIRIVEKLFPAIRTNSVASIATDGLLGNKFLLIGVGTTGLAPPGWTFASREPFEIGDLFMKIRETVADIDMTVREVKGDVAGATGTFAESAKRVDRMIASAEDPFNRFTAAASRISKTLAESAERVDRIIAGAEDPFNRFVTAATEISETLAESSKRVDRIIVSAEEPINRVTTAAGQISEDAGAILARVRSGKGTVGKLVNDEAIYNSVADSARAMQQVMNDLRETSGDVKNMVARFKAGEVPEDIDRTMKNVSETSERIKSLVATFQPHPGDVEGMTADLRATLSNAREAMSDLAEDLEALKHSFFFRGFFKDRGFFDLESLSPAEYRSKAFEKNVTKERVWVQQGDLFIVRANGAEELSDPGRKKLDAMMANFLQFTNERAVIVEGYSAAGTTDEQFLRSRDRATKVRDYLIKRFTLSSGYIGVMPMGATADQGDGVALVLLKK